MADDTRISRSVELDLAPDELWSLVADGEGWASWLVDEADVAVEPESVGTVIDDGEARDVHIDRVERHERVTFTWWPREHRELATTVELAVLPGRLQITEIHHGAQPASAALRWDVRALVLGALALAAHVRV